MGKAEPKSEGPIIIPASISPTTGCLNFLKTSPRTREEINIMLTITRKFKTSAAFNLETIPLLLSLSFIPDQLLTNLKKILLFLF
jgi:hypothetical protein